MGFQTSTILIAAVAGLCGLTTAINDDSAPPMRRQASCPSVWSDAAVDLKSSFTETNGTCTDDARAAIRLSFHDCFPGACDGSIILANECTDRGENSQLVDICSIIGSKASQYNVSTADMIQFATGKSTSYMKRLTAHANKRYQSAIAIASCPGGPTISFKAGRADSTTANPTGQMPGPSDNATVLIAAFEAKGFTATELVALVGAHSAAKNLAGTGLDSTPGDWDTEFYTETADGTAPTTLDSDKFLSNSSETSSVWSSFAESSSSWQDAFVPAMEKMSLLGNDISNLVDCSSVITGAFASSVSAAQAQADLSNVAEATPSTSISSNDGNIVGKMEMNAPLALVLSLGLLLIWR